MEQQRPPLTTEALRQFIETQPLYSPMRVAFPDHRSGMPKEPRAVDFDCRVCERPRTFRTLTSTGAGGPWPVSSAQGRRRVGPRPEDDAPTEALVEYQYECDDCGLDRLTVWAEFSPSRGWVRKVGQRPPLVTQVSHAIRKALGDDTDFYQRAVRCIDFGFGIGACIYMRRVIEDHVNDVLRCVIDEIMIETPAAPEIEKLESLTTDVVSFETKIKTAAEHAPASIRDGNLNPLKIMFDELSKVVHQRTDAEAVESARRLQGALEYTLVELKRRHAARQAMIGTLGGKP